MRIQAGQLIDVRMLSETEFRSLVLSHLAFICNTLKEFHDASNGQGTADGRDANDARGNALVPDETEAPCDESESDESEATQTCRIISPGATC